MSDLDLTEEAVEAAARAGYEAVDITGVPWSARAAVRNVFRYGKDIRRAEATLAAAAPLIERQVREQVARALILHLPDGYVRDRAARIARGDS